MNHEIETLFFICQNVSRANKANMNAPSLEESITWLSKIASWSKHKAEGDRHKKYTERCSYISSKSNMFDSNNMEMTEHRGREVNSPASHSEGPELKSRPGDRLSRLRVSSVPPGKFWDRALKLGHEHFLPNPFQFIIHLSPYHSTLYSKLLKSFIK
jgi:hypothetical protein